MTTHPSFKDRSFAPHLALVLVQIGFGTWPIFGKVILRSISSTTLVGFRICGAAIIFTLLQQKIRELLRLPKKVIAWLVLTSLLGVVLNQLLFVKGLSFTTAINATLITTTIPVFSLAISIALRHDRATLKNILGIVLAAAGVVYLVDPSQASFTAANTLGNTLILTSSFCYGAYIPLSRDLLKQYGALNVITWIFLIGSALTLPIAIPAWSNENWEAVPFPAVAGIVYVVLFPTVCVYYLNAWALTKVSPGIVAIYIYLQPLLAFGVAPLVLGESLNSRTLLACILIFAGVAIVTIRARNRAIEEVYEHPDAMSH